MALLDRIAAIATPTLVIAGDHDIATPFYGHGDKIQGRIVGARAAMMPCAHLAPVELPASFAAQLKTFLSGERHG
jgi:3-oxoadipate enol-lactonase/4-carboxymuconolactone decarboxylase